LRIFTSAFCKIAKNVPQAKSFHILKNIALQNNITVLKLFLSITGTDNFPKAISKLFFKKFKTIFLNRRRTVKRIGWKQKFYLKIYGMYPFDKYHECFTFLTKSIPGWERCVG